MRSFRICWLFLQICCLTENISKVHCKVLSNSLTAGLRGILVFVLQPCHWWVFTILKSESALISMMLTFTLIHVSWNVKCSIWKLTEKNQGCFYFNCCVAIFGTIQGNCVHSFWMQDSKWLKIWYFFKFIF